MHYDDEYQADDDDEYQSYAGKLPSIRSAFSKQKNGSKKGRNREEFSCIDVDNFSVSGKTVMVNASRDMKERTNCRTNFPSPGRHNCPGEEIWENNAAVKSCLAEIKPSDSANSCNAFVYRPRQLLHGRNQQRTIFTSPGYSKSGRPSDLPDKFARFLEKEFSIK